MIEAERLSQGIPEPGLDRGELPLRAAPKEPWPPRKVTRFVPVGTLDGIVIDPVI
jgi:hypothetical protein